MAKIAIGEIIRERREKLGIKQQELAERVCVSTPMLSMIERGTKMPSIRLAADIAHALGCEFFELAKDEIRYLA